MSNFGQNLAAERHRAGWSAQILSDKLGGQPSRSVIANWENGRKDDVTVRDLIRISEVLEVTPADLYPELDFGRAARVESARRILAGAALEALKAMEPTT